MLGIEISNKRKQNAFLAIYLCNFLPSLYVFHFSFKYSESEEALVSLFGKILIIHKFTTKPVHNIDFIYVCYLSIIRNLLVKFNLHFINVLSTINFCIIIIVISVIIIIIITFIIIITVIPIIIHNHTHNNLSSIIRFL